MGPLFPYREDTKAPTWQHLLHVDLAQLEQVGQPLSIFQLGHLLQAEEEKWEVGAVLQWVGQLCHAHEFSNDCPGSKLSQVRFHQGNIQLNLGTLVQNIEESL